MIGIDLELQLDSDCGQDTLKGFDEQDHNDRVCNDICLCLNATGETPMLENSMVQVTSALP